MVDVVGDVVGGVVVVVVDVCVVGACAHVCMDVS
jgi:hypothetical protein